MRLRRNDSWVAEHRGPALILEAIGALSLGMVAMYLFDPSEGRRRRALIRDKAVHLGHELSEGCQRSAHATANRARGIAARSARVFHRGPVSDETLLARVRAELGRIVSHSKAVYVASRGGVITVGGPILAHEATQLIPAIESVPGVRRVNNLLEVHVSAAGVSALQG